mmetsp:Transcript_21213/g.56614  ORF Transcript_21213/g.56614 Transcript_21213/m.56614 type:complete len:95 (+) Transcript_21213:373-657(+)
MSGRRENSGRKRAGDFVVSASVRNCRGRPEKSENIAANEALRGTYSSFGVARPTMPIRGGMDAVPLQATTAGARIRTTRVANARRLWLLLGSRE